ncbi:uncharacterized protein LOC136751170 isoform X2 [Amia ocellicauda]|uniref:uncharacterized protein LOC136751170 isoform X2 n=1 Tax=Amia ocellicauda TaxID=2972642 RepID=UPI00346401AC
MRQQLLQQKPICPTVESLMNSLLDLVPKNTAEDLKRALVSGNVLHEYRHILKDMEMQLKGVLDFLQQHIHQLDRLTQDNQKQVVENKHKEERPSESHSSNKLHQPSEDPWTSIYPPKSDVLIEIVHGQNMLGIERMFMSKLSQHLANFAVQVVTKTYDHTSVNSVLLFCPVFSRTGTVIEEALKKIPSTKEIVLVVMHHTHNPDLVLAESSRLVKKCNLAEIVDCLFHESRGLLECEINSQAILQVSSALQKYLT